MPILQGFGRWGGIATPANYGGPTPPLQALVGPVDNGGAVNLAWPVGIQANDIAIIHALIVDSSNANALTVPSGFTLIDNVPLHSDVSTTSGTGIFWRRLDGSETGSVSITTVSGVQSTDTLAAGMSIWRGCKTTGDPYEGAAMARSISPSLTGSAVTTLGFSRRVLNFGATYTTASATPASGWTEQYDYLAEAGTGEGSLSMFSKERVGAGTESAAVHALDASRRWVTFSLALIPA
jgi:hypothetical protein